MLTDESSRLLASFDANGVLGELTGREEAELDSFFRKTAKRAREELESSRRLVAESGREVCLDASALSGVNEGDHWWVSPTGVRRRLQVYPEAETVILAPPVAKEPCQSLAEARPLLARCAYNGLWSPSGTNWQPVRTLELTAEEAKGIFGLPACGLAVLSRARYDSLLGDIASLAGREPKAGAEHIDPGIWLEAAVLSARGHGWELEAVTLSEEDGTSVAKLVHLLEGRARRLKGPSAVLATELCHQLSEGQLIPVAALAARRGQLLRLDENAPGGLAPSQMDRLFEARSTQRVANPAGELEKEAMEEIFEGAFEGARRFSSQRIPLSFSIHHWQEDLPRAVGQAMHRGLYGEGGLLADLNLENLRSYLRRQGCLSPELAAWANRSGSEAYEQASEVAIDMGCLPRNLSRRLLQVGGYRQEGGRLLDHRDRPLTPERLCRLLLLMARGFGKFFLSFQNTHPWLGIFALQRPDRNGLFELGRLVERMTLLARARGLVSIIKSGPVEIAGEEIRRILERAGAPCGEPMLTFQLGLPLGPDDRVGRGTPAEHDGLQERLLDRRAGRARLSQHYLPAG